MVAEELNITRAAERLYISQQSLSSHISNMERELNVKLFTRSPKLALTYAGDQLVQTATQIIDLYSQYLSKVGDINRHYLGVLRVGISHTCGLALLPDILPRFREEFPVVDFSLYEGNSNQLEDELSHGRVDLVICFQHIMLDGVETVPLTQQRLVMVVPKSFTGQLFGAQAEVIREQFSNGADIGAFQSMPFVLIKRGNRTRSIVDQYFSRYYFKPQLILETENLPGAVPACHPRRLALLRRGGLLPPHRPIHLQPPHRRLSPGPPPVTLRRALHRHRPTGHGE